MPYLPIRQYSIFFLNHLITLVLYFTLNFHNKYIQPILYNISAMNIQNNPIDHNQASPHYEDDYDEQQQDHGLEVVIQNKQPQEYVISLKKQNNDEGSAYRSEKDDEDQKQKLIGKLKGILQLKIEQIKQVKKNINHCKKQIKEIGEQVDKQMNKSILKHSKPHTNINIQQIFQQQKSTDPQINILVSQLSKIRSEIKKTKGQVKNIQNKIMGPINIINIQRASQIKSKIKQTEAEIKKLKEQKEYIEMELKIMQDGEGSYDVGNDEQMKVNMSRNMELIAELKEQKNKMYQIEKQDRTITQKIRYIQQLQQISEYKKSKSTTVSISQKQKQKQKQQIQILIKQIIEQIKQILDKRNKIENQRKNIYKSLEIQVSNLQTKNWDIINKLREIDARLIKHYNSRLKKNKGRKESPHDTTAIDELIEKPKEKQKQKPMDNSISTIRTNTIYPQKPNDKNIEQPPTTLIQKRKSYDFFMSTSETQNLGNICLSDQMLGNKLQIKRLHFLLDDTILYGIHADYENQYKNEIHGYKIMSRIKPKQIISKILLIDNSKNQVINFMHVGVDKADNVKFLHIVTSEAKEFKWGNLEVCVKNQQKNLRKYENVVIKGKLNQIYEKEAPNYYCLGGIGLSILYLAPK